MHFCNSLTDAVLTASGFFFPVFELRQLVFKEAARLVGGSVFVRQMPDKIVDELAEVVIHIFAVGIAPLAEVLVEAAVDLTAERAVVERHSAALADQLSRRAEQCVYRNVVQL